MNALHGVSRPTLLTLAHDLRSGALLPPYTAQALRKHVEPPLDTAVASEFQRYAALGMAPAHLAETLQLLAEARTHEQEIRDRVELVWTGPEVPGTVSRDTSVVVRQLFQRAKRSVLIAGYAVAQGRQLFEPLAKRMAEEPALAVRMFLNIPRPYLDNSTDDAILRAYVTDFFSNHWPWERRPGIFFDPRALGGAAGGRASLHAKCVVIDNEVAFITSANFTEAAHDRNIEAGVLVQDAVFARSLVSQFEILVSHGVLHGIPEPRKSTLDQ